MDTIKSTLNTKLVPSDTLEFFINDHSIQLWENFKKVFGDCMNQTELHLYRVILFFVSFSAKYVKH